MRRGAWLKSPILWLAVGVATLHVLTMPRFFYPGDNFAPRMEVAYLLSTGEYGIPYSYRAQLAGFVEQKGQYLFENDRRQKFFSKYGVGYSLLYVPPLVLEKLHSGKLDFMGGTRSLLFFINLYQILLTIIALCYLYGISGFYTRRTWVRMAFVLASFYSTFMWNYLRAPALEIFQIFPFLGFYYHFLRFLRGRVRDEDASPWRHLAFAMSWLGLLFLTKVTHGLLFGIAGLFAAAAGSDRRTIRENVTLNLTRHWRRYLVAFVPPVLVTAIVFLAFNSYRCDSIFEDGYRQWVMKNGERNASLHLSAVPGALKGLFVTPSEYNVFVTYPLFAFALLGVWRFGKRHPWDLAFLLAVFFPNLFLVACLKWWSGSWCYAPRYMLLPLLVGSLPFIETLHFLEDHLGRRARTQDGNQGTIAPRRGLDILRAGSAALLAMLMAVVLVWSLWMQICVNSLHYFAWEYLTGFLAPLQHERITRYFGSHYHRGAFYWDLMKFGWFGERHRLLDVLDEIAPPGQSRQQILRQVGGFLQQMAEPNYFLLRRDPRQRGPP